MIFKYLRDRLEVIIMLLVFILVFVTVFYLYGIPTNPALYGGGICFLCILPIVLFDYVKYNSRHKDLVWIKNNLIALIDRLPKEGGLIEQDYRDIVMEFDNCYRGVISSMDKRHSEMMDFYTMWVHQIKTPISAMSMLLQQQEGEVAAQNRQELFKIERYVELVLGYLRMDSISSDLQLGEYNLESIVNQAVKKYAPVFIYKKLGVSTFDLDISVLTDEKWLTFVIEQLISNCVKYTNEGKIEIYADKNKVLHIVDTGIGISSEDLPRVFEKGFTGYNGRMDKKSTGLGLYLCKRTLSKLRHKIAIESNVGGGTTILIDMESKDMVYE